MASHRISGFWPAGIRLRTALASVVMAVLWLIGAGQSASAHDVPPSIALLDIGRNAIDVELQLQLSELGTASMLPLAANPDAVISQYGSRIERYVQDRLQVHDPAGRSYAMRIESLSMRRTDNANWTSNDWLVLHARLQAPQGASTEVFSIDYAVIMQRVLSHQALIYVRRDIRNELLGDQPQLLGVLGFGKTHLKVDGSAGSWWKGFSRLYLLGMRHIAEGSDHLLFLLALLLPAPLLANGRHWRATKSTADSVKTIVSVVSGFTLGHSLTLALASAGWVSAPTRGIEVAIAASILISSIHAWRPLFAGRELWLALTFGLVHGLAFATTLSGLNFDGYTLALSLLGFNLGIESMQLLVIAATLPLMIILSTTPSYAAVRIGGAACAAACALGWILERAFNLANPLQPVVDWLAAPPQWLITSVCVASGASIIALCARMIMASAPISSSSEETVLR